MKPSNIENLLTESTGQPPSELRSLVLSSIDKSVRKKQRQDDLRVFAIGTLAIAVVAMVVYGMVRYQHSQIKNLVASVAVVANQSNGDQ